ncbi:MAG: hypothetical protein AB4063_02255 [Crocosphaera sp.]
MELTGIAIQSQLEKCSESLTNTKQIRHSSDIEEEEAHFYAKGTLVEIKGNPGQVYQIAEYDPMLVPPIWLENEAMPRYPHELQRLHS